MCLRLGRLPVALSLCLLYDLPFIPLFSSPGLPLLSFSPLTINVNINKDVTRLLGSAVQSVVVATNYHSQGTKASGGFNPAHLDR